MARILVALAAFVACSLGITCGTMVPARADTSSSTLYGQVATGVIDSRTDSSFIFGFAGVSVTDYFWLRCTFAARVSVTGTGILADAHVRVVSVCNHGKGVDVGPFNSTVRIGLTGSSCDDGYANDSAYFAHVATTLATIPDTDTGAGTTSDLSYPNNCGSTSQLCLDWAIANWPGSGGGCVPLVATWPSGDPAAAAYLGSGQSGCAAFTPLEPWVTTPAAVPVSGGWAWQSQVTWTVQGQADPPTVQIGGAIVYVDPLVGWSSSGTVTVTRPDNGSSYSGGAGSSQFYVSSVWKYNSGYRLASTTAGLTLTGPVHTGTVGSVPLDWQYTQVGYGWYNSGAAMNGSHTTALRTASALATDTQLAASYTGATTSAMGLWGMNVPSKCSFAWGSYTKLSFEAAPSPIDFQAASTPPTSAGCLSTTPATCTTTEPNIIVNDNGACAGATGSFTCLETPATDGSDNSDGVPGADSSTGKCIFTASDPSTWVAGSLCELVQLGIQSNSLLVSCVFWLEAIANATTGAATSVVVPPSDPTDTGSIDYNSRTIMALFGASALSAWINSATSTMDNVPADTSSCDGPALDMSGLHVPTFTVMHPFSTCSASQQAFASKAHSILLAGVYVAGVWTSARLVMWSFGITLPGKENS